MTIVGPFYCHHGLVGEILDQSCRFKLTGRANTIEIHMDQRQAPFIICVNQNECRTGHSQWRCAKTLRDSANECRLTGSERSIERDRFSPTNYAADRLA